MVLPYVSFAVTVRLSLAPAVGVTDAAASPKLAAAAKLTVTGRPVPLLTVPEVTVMLAVSALYRIITPLFAPDVVAIPLVNVIAVAVAKAVAAPPLVVTVGLLPFGLLPAPPNVRLCEAV